MNSYPPGGRASVRPTPLPAKGKSKWRFLWILVILAVLASVAYFAGPPLYRKVLVAPLEKPTNPTFFDEDKVLLKVPPLGMAKDTSVVFRYGKDYAESIDDQLPFKPISTPVDIITMSGELKPDKVSVTLAYDRKLIPEGLTADQVGMAVYDQTLQTWVPILHAKADPNTDTVTAIAPHFSWFAAFVLDPLKKAVNVAGQTIETVINASIKVQSWFTGLVNEVAGNFVKDLFGQVDPLNCSPASTRIKSQPKSSFDLLKSCVTMAGNNDRLHLSNGFAFPMLTGKLPPGIKLEAEDLANNGEDLAALVRSAYWASQNQAYLSGASNTSVTVTNEVKSNAQITMELDDEAIAFDIGMAVLSVLAPPSNVAKAGVKSAAAAIIKGQSVAQLTGDGMAWFNTVYDLLDCVVSGTQNWVESQLGADIDEVDQMHTKEGYEDAAGLAHNCLGSILEGISLKGALSEVLSSIKVIPEVLSAVVYTTGGALLDSLPSQFDGIKQQQPRVTIARLSGGTKPQQQEEPQAQPKPKPKPQPDKPSASLKDVAGFAGKWKHSNGTLTINKNGTGRYTVNGFCQPDDPGLSDFQACSIAVGVRFVDAGNGGGIYGYWQRPVARSARDGQNNKIVQLAPRDLAAYVNKRFEVTRSTNEHIISVSAQQPEERFGGQHWMCDKYAHDITVAGRQTGGLYRERCNKPF